MINKNSLFLTILSLFIFFSCSDQVNKPNPNPNKSSSTGWGYNDRKQGGLDVARFNEQTPGPGLTFIEGGTFTMGRVEEDVISDWNNISKTVHVSSFYMDITEVRNIDYLEYLDWIKKHYIYDNEFQRNPNVPLEDGIKIYNNALPDTLVWRDKLGENEIFVTSYLRHPAFREYPVVGVSWEQANDYCKWRTDRVNEKILIEAGYLLPEGHEDRLPEYIFTTEAYLYGDDTYLNALVGDKLKSKVKNLRKMNKDNDEGRYLSMEDGVLLPYYRLPTEAEWEIAALGYIGDNIENRKIYPWQGSGLRNSTRKNQGQFLANFKGGRGGNTGSAGESSGDLYSVTGPVASYWPNDYGLFDMAGNVSEWTADVYRPVTELTTTTDNNPYRGNVFVQKKKNQNSQSSTSVVNPYIINNQGIIEKEEIDPDDKSNIYRRNYKRSNNVNYLDGDIESIAGSSTEDILEFSSKDSSRIQLNKRDTSGNNRNESDQLYNNSNEMYDFGTSTLVSDRSRVYKGGSWNDRAYWLSPGTRRFLDQSRSSSTIGFRCAMDRTGTDKSNIKPNQNRGTDYSQNRGR